MIYIYKLVSLVGGARRWRGLRPSPFFVYL